jgi:hypothetical protein
MEYARRTVVCSLAGRQSPLKQTPFAQSGSFYERGPEHSVLIQAQNFLTSWATTNCTKKNRQNAWDETMSCHLVLLSSCPLALLPSCPLVLLEKGSTFWQGQGWGWIADWCFAFRFVVLLYIILNTNAVRRCLTYHQHSTSAAVNINRQVFA